MPSPAQLQVQDHRAPHLVLTKPGEQFAAQPHLREGWFQSCHQEPEKWGVHGHHVFLCPGLCVCPSRDPDLCLSFSVYPLAAPVSTASYQSWCQPIWPECSLS